LRDSSPSAGRAEAASVPNPSLERTGSSSD
jgi:hypothetical protein